MNNETQNTLARIEKLKNDEEKNKKAFELVRKLFKNERGEPFELSKSQITLFRAIYEKWSPRIQIETYTGFGKSDTISMAVLARASTFPEDWAIVGGTKEKAKIIMSYVTKHIFENEYTRGKLELGEGESLERLRRERSKDKLTFRIFKESDQIGQIRILSGEAGRIGETAGDILVGHHVHNIVEDDAPLIPDIIHGKMMRMLDDADKSFLAKVGNTIRRNHFYRSHKDPRYYKIIVDCEQGIREGRVSREYIDEMRQEMDPLQFSMFYECNFPPEETYYEGGWLRLILDRDLDSAFISQAPYAVGKIVLGVDVAGLGRNYSEVAFKCDSYGQIILKDQKIDPIALAVKVMEMRDAIIREKNLNYRNVVVVVDTMGVGTKTYGKMKEHIPEFVYGVLGGDPARNKNVFVNRRAENFWRMKDAILSGFKLVRHNDFNQLRQIFYKVQTDRRIKIMSKEEMFKRGIQSPDGADALALSFAVPSEPLVDELYPQLSIKTNKDFDVYE